MAQMARGGLRRLGYTQAKLTRGIGLRAIFRRVAINDLLHSGQIGLALLNRLIAYRYTGRLLGAEREIKGAAQSIDIGAQVGARTTRILFGRSVARGALMANEEERAYAI